MKTIEEIKATIKKSIVSDDNWQIKPNITIDELKDLWQSLEDGRKHQRTDTIEEWRELISTRIYGCWMSEIEPRIKELDPTFKSENQNTYPNLSGLNFGIKLVGENEEVLRQQNINDFSNTLQITNINPNEQEKVKEIVRKLSSESIKEIENEIKQNLTSTSLKVMEKFEEMKLNFQTQINELKNEVNQLKTDIEILTTAKNTAETERNNAQEQVNQIAQILQLPK